MKLHRLAPFAAVAAAALILTGCANASPSDSAAPSESAAESAELHALLPDDIASAGKIVIGTEAYYPPYGFLDTDGATILGIEPDLLDAITARLGITYDLENVAFDTLLPSLSAGRYDLIAAAMTQTPERAENYTFINHFIAGQAIITLAGETAGKEKLDGLCGLTVAVLQDSAQEGILEGLNEEGAACAGNPVDVLRQPTDTDALLQVQSKRADASLAQEAVGRYNAAQVGGGSVFEVANTEPIKPSLLGHVVRNDETQLAEAWAAALQSLIDDGTYQAILEKWDTPNGAVDSATINGTLEQ